jgi:hypothetical protein
VQPVLAGVARTSRASFWRLLVDAPSSQHPLLTSLVGPLAAATVCLLTVALVVAARRDPRPGAILAAGLLGYLAAGTYVLPWYFAWVLPLVALAWRSLPARLVLLQSFVILFAYQYQPSKAPDSLDLALGAVVTGAQLVALLTALGAAYTTLDALPGRLGHRALRGSRTVG